MEDLSLESKPIRLTRILQPAEIIYCHKCKLPCEYCEFDSKLSASCKEVLRDENPEAYAKVYGPEEGEAAAGNEEEGGAGKEGNATAKPQPKKKGPAKKRVTIMIEDRTKRKRITHVGGLELFGIDLKKASKMFASKFAASAAVSKKGDGSEEIVIQGDCEYDLPDYLLATFPAVQDGEIEILEPKKKKKAGEEESFT